MDQETFINNLSNTSVSKNNYLMANSQETHEFKPQDMNEITGGLVAIIAPTGAGKTVLLKHLLSVIHNNYDEIRMFSKTAKLQQVYNFFPKSKITDYFDEERLKYIWEKQNRDHADGKTLKSVIIINNIFFIITNYRTINPIARSN